ncbi:MAG: adenylosuccinate synthetase [Candidatus Saccharibacteria bacterium]
MDTRAVIVTDISYGDAGKGTTVDYLVRQAAAAAVIRHNGGSQAAHNVITPGGRHHTFAQFGSGSFVSGTRTHLSRHMLVNPLNMFPEAEHLESLGVRGVWARTTVDRDALVITPWQCSANQLRELARGAGRHGSCGQGIGETMADSLAHPDLVLHVRDIQSNSLHAKLSRLRAYKLSQLRDEQLHNLDGLPSTERQALLDPLLIDSIEYLYREWAERVQIVDGSYLKFLARQHELLVFEGAQGVLLDEWYGFHPYTTWSTTTHANAMDLLREQDFDGEITRMGVLRAYTTRHGAGPFVSEDRSLASDLAERHNGLDDWQGAFRYGHLDLLAHQYALAACGATDELVMTGLDRLQALPTWNICDGYRLVGYHPDADRFFTFGPNGTIAAIKLGIQGDLDHQERLGQLLASCSPVYHSIRSSDTFQESIHGYLHTVEDRLGLPITITSFGPTAADKRSRVMR